MSDHTFVTTYEYGYEGSSVQGVFLTFEEAETFALNALDLGWLQITEWNRGVPVQAWRRDDWWHEPPGSGKWVAERPLP